MAARISAVIPVRNRPEVVHRAIDSVLAQTRPVDEVIVVDDGSTDHTPDTIERRRREVPHLKLVRQVTAGGAPRARNAGVEAATGEIIAFLDSDDSWAVDKIARQEALLDEVPSCQVVGCGIRYNFRARPPRFLRPPPVITHELLQRSNVAGGTSVGMVKRAAFERVGGFHPDLPACQDWDLWLRLTRDGDMRAVDAPLVVYHFDAAERISKGSDRVMAGHNHVFSMVYAEIGDRHVLREVRSAHAARLAMLFSSHHFAPGKALGYAWQAFRLSPTPRRALEIPKIGAKLALFKLT